MSLPLLKSPNLGSGQPLVLLHAFPLSHLLWKFIHPPKGYQLILPDFPGFGLSPLASPGLSLSDAAQGLARHLDEKGITGPIVLGGISMGGYWALEFIRQYPERVGKLLLISIKAGADQPEARQNRLNMAQKVAQDGTEYLVSAMIPGLLGKTTQTQKPDVVAQVGQWIRETPAQAVAGAQRAMADRRDQKDSLPKIQCETLVMAGLEDTLIPSTEAQAMAEAIPNRRLELLERVGHLIPIEDPNLFQKTIDRFLNP